jgi:hypothetical protein
MEAMEDREDRERLAVLGWEEEEVPPEAVVVAVAPEAVVAAAGEEREAEIAGVLVKAAAEEPVEERVD